MDNIVNRLNNKYVLAVMVVLFVLGVLRGLRR